MSPILPWKVTAPIRDPKPSRAHDVAFEREDVGSEEGWSEEQTGQRLTVSGGDRPGAIVADPRYMTWWH
ncbi:hypothetical protein W59_21768 [Rhodococcus opacus RKJ300 = JCM 13270]|uniref:Uncharacterized protein n=1 Tax=Rhodococcus opacus RKJ300 = JCM 13270 TaxID=1165867 RepID=I0WN27_RHOOP|nr:hypothetical protein W59_21768 [Rhodococcus opacus RKJ300 = JCM 13270]